MKRKLRVAKGEGRFHREGKLGRRDKVGYRAAWVLCLGVLFHRKTILGCHAPDPDSHKIIGQDGKQDRTGPDQAKRNGKRELQGRREGGRGMGEVGRGASDYSFSYSPWFVHLCSYICSRSFTASGLYPSVESPPYSAEMPGACFSCVYASCSSFPD